MKKMSICIERELIRKIKVGRIPLGTRACKIEKSKKAYNRQKEKSVPNE